MDLPTKNRVSIKTVIGQHLALRYSADKLFDYIDSLKNADIIIDFNGVHTTSRSFMQQFLYRLQKSDIPITCINEAENIKKMRDIVTTPKGKPVIVNPAPERVMNLSSLVFQNDDTIFMSREERETPSPLLLESPRL